MSMEHLTESSSGFEVIGHHDLNGYGDAMQVMREGSALYIGHFGTSGMGTSVLDVSDPTAMKVVEQWPAPQGTHTHKVQVADGLLVTNQERFKGGDPWAAGLAVHSLEDPFHPRQIGYWRSTGGGVHRPIWTGGDYAYVSATPEGYTDRIFVIVDLRDPEHPVEAGRWWWPGQHVAAGEDPTWPEGKRYAAHHGLIDGDVAYVGWDDAGMVILDISDVSAPKMISNVTWPGVASNHTCMPLSGRGLVVTTDEETKDEIAEGEKRMHVVDVSDLENPQVVGQFPSPGTEEFGKKGLRFGPHNFHENRPGTYRSEQMVFAAYFNAGIRAYDLEDPTNPVEVGHWLPSPPPAQETPQTNDLFIDLEYNMWVVDRRSGGVYVIRPQDDMLERMKAAQLQD